MPNTHLDPSQKTTIIFDLDGTLVDVEPLFIEIFNQLAPKHGCSPILPDEIPALKKMGAKAFMQARVQLSFWKIWWLIWRGKEEYAKRIETIELFPRMKEVIQQLRSNGYHIGILSSNRKDTIQKLILKFGLEIDFVYQSTLFGKARAIKKALQEEGLSATEVIYIGDEVRDVLACREASVDVLSVSWGLNAKETLEKTGATTLDTPEALLDILAPKI